MGDCLHCGLPVPPRRSGDYCCFGCRIMHGVVRPAGANGETGPVPLLRVQMFAGLFTALNVMALSFAFYGPGVFGEAAVPTGIWGTVSDLFEYLILFLTTIVVATLGLPLFYDALQDGAGRWSWVNARTLLCAGVFSAFTLSAWHTSHGAGPIYYDTVTMVLVVITIGKHLEARAKRRAVAELCAALGDLPARVDVIRNGRSVEVETNSLVRGDLVCVKPGQAIPVDGVVEDGCSFVDSSGITGEPHAVAVTSGDRIFAGSIALDGMLRVRAEHVASGRLLAHVDRLLRDALASRFPAVRSADRIARFLAPAIVLISLTITIAFARQGMADAGILRGLSVLLIACPCALAIGPGLIMAAAMRRAARRGILFTSPETVEQVADLTRLFLDKTGTLTRASSHVDAVDVPDTLRRKTILELLASIEAHGRHPIATGLLDFARKHGIEPRSIEAYRVLPGLGVEARVDGRRYRVGGARLLESLGLETQSGATGEPRVYLVDDRTVLATAHVSDPARPDAQQTLTRLEELGVHVSGLSGDTAARSRSLGETLGISITGDLFPEDKVECIRDAVEAPHRGTIAMAGDGINDAAALARSDVGIAMASASDLSKQAGGLLLLRERLSLIPDAIAIARDARRRLAWSITWAIGYNAVGVGLAVTGRLHPVFAATAMAVSSLLVIAFSRNAGTLRDDTETADLHAAREASA